MELVSANLRSADLLEISASSGQEPLEAILNGNRRSDRSAVALVDGLPVCVMGVGRLSSLSEVGVPWMLGTADLDRYAVTLMKMAPGALDEMKAGYGRLENYVDARNTRSIRWLKRLGFAFEDPAPFGVAGLPFHRFWMEC